MTTEVLWLARLGIDQGLFTQVQALTVARAVGAKAELMDFAQKLIDDAIVDDVDKLERIAGLALEKAKTGDPASNPFMEEAPAGDEGAQPGKAALNPERAFGSFDFGIVASLSDAGVADFMRKLLTTTGLVGASDLHLSTGAKPFIRQNRALTNISETLLTAEDALRLNTSLLTESQRATYLDKKDYDYALALDLSNRYRVNLMFHKQGAAGAYRMLTAKSTTIGGLG